MIDHKVRLIVLDSAACLARADFAPGSLPDRQRMLGQQVGQGWDDKLVDGWFACQDHAHGLLPGSRRMLGQQAGPGRQLAAAVCT